MTRPPASAPRRSTLLALSAALALAGCAPGAREAAPSTESPAAIASAPLSAELRERFQRMSGEAEARGLADPFRGVVFGGAAEAGLFPVRSTGVSTEPVRRAAEQFLSALSPEQRRQAQFAADDPEWRKWMNQHFYLRRGVGFNDMTPAQRDAAFGLLRASLSAHGLRTSRDIMRLNHTLAEINDDFQQYGELLYWITLMGTPSATEPWGWQIDGHHLVINYFVLGDQVVMTPTFMGSEPVLAEGGRYGGTSILQAEQDRGLALMRSLSPAQQARATVQAAKTRNSNVGEAFRDNLDLDYTGIPATELTAAQREELLGVIESYVSHMREGHARVRMEEVRRQLDRTWFAWIGGTGPDAVFYYRVQSPVILIEFDHQSPIAMPALARGVPTRQHIHTVVRTPNGNDYGKDLLRQHYEQHPHPHGP